MPSAPRGRFTTGTSRTGRGFNFAGRNVRMEEGSNFQLAWAGADVVRFANEVLEAVFSTLQQRGLQFMQQITPYRTGELYRSLYVRLEASGSRVRLVIGATAGHAIYVELGTFKMAAQPYIRPTFDFLAGQILPLLRAEARARGY